MPERPFRFLHTSDFRLDAVPRGLAEVPDHLRDCLLNAPFTAARRTFDAAISERVAFVLLCGNILQAEHAGPRDRVFGRAVRRLAAAGINAYWAASDTDRLESGLPRCRCRKTSIYSREITWPNFCIRRRAAVGTHCRHEPRRAVASCGRFRARSGRLVFDRRRLRRDGLRRDAIAGDPLLGAGRKA